MGIRRLRTLQVAGVIALGLLVAGCDKCGNFLALGGLVPQACKSDTAQPR